MQLDVPVQVLNQMKDEDHSLVSGHIHKTDLGQAMPQILPQLQL